MNSMSKSPDEREESEMQREHERERRRMRDRQRRESMTAEEREKHLARRRRNYQLRRQRAGNAQSGSDGDQAFHAEGQETQTIVDASEFSVGQSSGWYKDSSLKMKDLDFEGGGHGSEKLSIFCREIKLSQVRHLARSLNSYQRKLMSACLFSNGSCSGKLRVTQLKRLARELNSSMNDITIHLRQSTARSSGSSQETSSSQGISHNSADPLNGTELDNLSKHGESLSLTEVNCLQAPCRDPTATDHQS